MRCFSVIQVAGQLSTMLALRQASPLPPSWPFCRPAGPLPPSWPFAAKLALCRQDGPLPPGRFQLLITIPTASVLNCQQQQRLSTCPLHRCCNSRHCVAVGGWALTSPLSCPKLKRAASHPLLRPRCDLRPTAVASAQSSKRPRSGSGSSTGSRHNRAGWHLQQKQLQ